VERLKSQDAISARKGLSGTNAANAVLLDHNHANMGDCIFCKVIKKEIPSYIIYEDENFISFLDINPKAFGHCLVVPKEHYDDIYSYREKAGASVIDAIRTVCLMIKENMNCAGLNVVQNNGRIAGQLIEHIHFHIIPRFEKEIGVNKRDFKAVLRMIKGESKA